MVNLQFRFIHLFKINKTLAAVLLNQGFPDLPRQARSSREAAKPEFVGIGKSVGCYLSPVRPQYREPLQGYAVLLYVTSGAGWVIVAVGVLQLFRRNMTVLENVINYRARALCCD